MGPLPRRLVAAFVGTIFLVLFGAGAVVTALQAGEGTLAYAGLAYAGLGFVALSFGLAIAVAIYAFGTTSGAHLNPAMTVSLAAVRRIGWGEVVPYVAVQLAGAVVAGLLILAVFGTAAADLGTGQTSFAEGTSFVRGVVGEALGTFLLVTAIMALAVDKRAPGDWAGLVIGLAVTCAILLLGNVTTAIGPFVTPRPDRSSRRDQPVRVEDELLGRALVEVSVALGRLVEG